MFIAPVWPAAMTFDLAATRPLFSTGTTRQILMTIYARTERDCRAFKVARLPEDP